MAVKFYWAELKFFKCKTPTELNHETTRRKCGRVIKIGNYGVKERNMAKVQGAIKNSTQTMYSNHILKQDDYNSKELTSVNDICITYQI